MRAKDRELAEAHQQLKEKVNSVKCVQNVCRGVKRIFQKAFPKRGLACDLLHLCVCMVHTNPVRASS